MNALTLYFFLTVLQPISSAPMLLATPDKKLVWKSTSNFSNFVMGGQFFLPQTVNNEKSEFFQLKTESDSRVSLPKPDH